MSQSYSQQLIQERNEQRLKSRDALRSYLTETFPSFEQCQEHLKQLGVILTKKDYNDICEILKKEKSSEDT